MRASTGGVLATKSERKMLASTCLYSFYAWLLSTELPVIDVIVFYCPDYHVHVLYFILLLL